jgi:hypothetical protein
MCCVKFWYHARAITALYPIDTIKTRLQAMIGGGGLRALLQQGGGKALYAGEFGYCSIIWCVHKGTVHVCTNLATNTTTMHQQVMYNVCGSKLGHSLV